MISPSTFTDHPSTLPASTRRPVRRDWSVNLALIGHSGQVGSALLHRLQQLTGLEVELKTVINRRQTGHREDGELQLVPRASDDLDQLMQSLRRAGRPALIIDCTADAGITELYPRWLRHGIGVVTPNKHGLSGDRLLYERIQATARLGRAPLRYSATVGAGLPILRTLARLRLAGDPPRAMEAALSGTLAHVLAQVSQGERFSAAVEDARRKGFTEPNPLEDLSGRDVARKLTIMLREAGFPDVVIQREGLVPDEWLTAPDGAQRLEQLDALWMDRQTAARRAGERWVYAARFDGRRARVGPVTVPADHPLAGLSGSGNLVRLQLATNPNTPLDVFGPGAGVAVTASAVMADVAEAVATFNERN
ncbi:hypothetical protein [Natronospira bacteriovora]|uniref:homoserine dehydrogenase n=1 Tax=Natronospira bacteriovora TaxID=3069753 RepID=A0ABU0W988_9GAMM|nr:hypothetical protein [Natronospira sp. AB-CW4]MDQ2069555.1 hypothetical protein [Natronospira sp. AB-CW4]